MGKDLKGKELGNGISQRKDGVYSARFVNRFGKRTELYSKDLKELKTKLAEAIYKDKNYVQEIQKITLSEWYKEWMEVHKNGAICDNTKRHYETVFKKHIEPVLGSCKLNDITQLQIKRLINSLAESGYQYETQSKVKIMLVDMFNKAIIDNYATRNPAKGITVIRDEKKEVRVLSREEQAEFFECCKGTFYDNLFTVMVSTGLRQGEACALTWDDIDLEKKVIHVTKTLLYQKLEGDKGKEFHFDPPKTKSSYRDVPINKQCEKALRKQYIVKQNVKDRVSAKHIKGFDNLLFVTRFNTPICNQTLSDIIRRTIDEINLSKNELEQFEYFSSHCFRHTFATRCFEANISPKTVQKFLGHATLQMTMDLYTHVLEDYQNEEMNKLENLLEMVENSGV